MTYMVVAEVDANRQFKTFAVGQTDLLPTDISLDINPSTYQATCMAFFKRNLSETDEAFELRAKREILKKYDQEREIRTIIKGARL